MGIFAYDNDWKGGTGPLKWTEHGGVFTAPVEASLAQIILGSRNAVYLIDDVSFELE